MHNLAHNGNQEHIYEEGDYNVIHKLVQRLLSILVTIPHEPHNVLYLKY